MIEHVIKQLAV